MDDLKSVDTDGKTLLHLLAYYAKSSNYVHVKDSDYKVRIPFIFAFI